MPSLLYEFIYKVWESDGRENPFSVMGLMSTNSYEPRIIISVYNRRGYQIINTMNIILSLCIFAHILTRYLQMHVQSLHRLKQNMRIGSCGLRLDYYTYVLSHGA